MYATIAGGEPYTERLFAAAPGLRVVARFGVGYDKFDVEAAEAAMCNRRIDSILAVAGRYSPGEEYVLNPETLRA